MITQDQIARRLSMPRATVAAALHPRLSAGLRPALRDRVQAAAREMGYVPHLAARRLAQGSLGRRLRCDQVGLITLTDAGENLDPVCLTMLSGAERELSKLSASILFLRVSDEADWRKVERVAKAGGVDGWLLYGPVDDAIVARLEAIGLPFVVLGDHYASRPVHNVNVDNAAVGREAARHLAALGHRRVAYVAGSFDFVYQRQMLEAFRAARAEFGLEADESLIVNLAALGGRAQEPASVLSQLDPSPTAVFVPDYGVGLHLYAALRQSPVEALRRIRILACAPISPDWAVERCDRLWLPLAEVGQRGGEMIHAVTTGAETGHRLALIPPTLVPGSGPSAPTAP